MLDNTDIDSAIPILQSREYRHFTVNPRTPVIGGVIEGGDFENMDDQFLDDLRDALWTYGVLFGKRRHLSFETMKNVARAFGDQFEHHSFANTLKGEGFPEVTIIERLDSTANRHHRLLFGSYAICQQPVHANLAGYRARVRRIRRVDLVR